MSIIGTELLMGAGTDEGYQVGSSAAFDSAANFSRTLGTATNRRIWTFSTWFKQGYYLPGNSMVLSTGGVNSVTSYTRIIFNPGGSWAFYDSLNPTTVTFANVCYDTSAWLHCVFAYDSTQSVAADRLRFYVNGTEISGSGTVPSNLQSFINSSNPHQIGCFLGNSLPTRGYLAETYFIDGQQLSPTAFGELDDDNNWQPIGYTGSYGVNGFYLNYSNNSTVNNLGLDYSGNSNNFTGNNMTVTGYYTNSTVDSPTNANSASASGGQLSGNYCTPNSLDIGAAPFTFDYSGRRFLKSSGPFRTMRAIQTIPSSGKWYWTVTPLVFPTGSGSSFGICLETTALDQGLGQDTTAWGYRFDGYKWNSNSLVTYGSTYGINDEIGVAFDADAGTLTFYKNGVSQGVAYTGLSGTFIPAFALSYNSGQSGALANFGAQPFSYAVPSGYKLLCTSNLPNPTSEAGTSYFHAQRYVGNGATQTVSGLPVAPDFVWIKSATNTLDHFLFNDLRGPTKYISTNASIVETTGSTTLTAFNSDGFTLGAAGGVNLNTAGFMSYLWDAGGSTVTNNTGTISASVRANPSSGFSILYYKGNGTANQTVGHGLGVTPQFIFTKALSRSSDIPVYHSGLTAGNTLRFNSTVAQTAYTGYWNSTFGHTSSVISIGSDPDVNDGVAGQYNLAFVFAPVEGYSVFKTYIGNGSNEGPYVHTGFRPRFLIIKNMDVAGFNWLMLDGVRSINVSPYLLQANTSDAEANVSINFFANGFRPNEANSRSNGSYVKYAVIAFADFPFKYARAANGQRDNNGNR